MTKGGNLKEINDTITAVKKSLQSFSRVDPLLQIKWIQDASIYSKPKGTLLFLPKDVGKTQIMFILEGSVMTFAVDPKNNPLYLQVLGAGETINERTVLTPFATEYGAVVISDSIKIVSFGVRSLHSDEAYKDLAGDLSRSMVAKDHYIELTKKRLLRMPADELRIHQDHLANRWMIMNMQLVRAIEDAQQQKKFAMFDKIRNAPNDESLASKFKVDALATQKFGYTRGLVKDAGTVKATNYLREMVSDLHHPGNGAADRKRPGRQG